MNRNRSIQRIMNTSIANNFVLKSIFPFILFLGCSEKVSKAEPTREEKVVYIQNLKEKILKTETTLIRLKFDKEKLNSRFSKISKEEITQRIYRLDMEIEELVKEILYLRSLNLDDVYDYP